MQQVGHPPVISTLRPQVFLHSHFLSRSSAKLFSNPPSRFYINRTLDGRCSNYNTHSQTVSTSFALILFLMVRRI